MYMLNNYFKSFTTPQAKIGLAFTAVSLIFYAIVLPINLELLQWVAFIINGAVAVRYTLVSTDEPFDLQDVQMNVSRHLFVCLVLVVFGAAWLAVAKFLHIAAYVYRYYQQQKG